MAGALIGGAFLSAALQVLFHRMASRPVLDFFKGRKPSAQLLNKLKTKMITINKVLDDAEDKQHTDPYVKQWLDELRDVVYKAEDFLDEIASEVYRSKIEAESQATLEKVQDSASSHNPFKTGKNEKLQEILGTLEHLVDQKDDLGLMSGTGRKPSYQRTPTTSIPDEAVIYGRDADKEAIMKWVLSYYPNSFNPDVLAIVGIGGMGKTTLAQHVYSDSRVSDCFDKKAWVCVSEEFNVFKVTKDILEGFTEKYSDRNNLDQLQRRLKDDLRGKKFLLVVDDVWSKDYLEWKNLLKPLMFGKEGSKILVTTRNEDVADCIKTSPPHKLKKLSNNDCWSLFEKHAFMGADMSSARPDLESIGRRIIEKCDGLPLAGKVVGGVLRSKREPREWIKLLESDMWELHNDNILPVLKISYRFLPSQLKLCFAYCAVFPKDYAFDKEKLIRLWMAEGLLSQPTGNVDIEQAGEDCFDDLVSRSFFQKSTERECFLMHDLINDLAKSISGGFCFRYGVDRSWEISERIRHLWIGYKEGNKVDKRIITIQHLRTILLRGLKKPKEVINWLSTLTRLRVLSLDYSSGLPDSIGNLMHLRYLDLTGSFFKRLPDSVASLYNLETLILYYCDRLVELPATIFKLINLSQLDIRGTRLRKMPPHMGKLKKLGELDYYILGKESHCSIKELGPLKRLRGHLRIEKLGNVSQVQESEEANLKGKEKLKELELIWNDDEGSEVSSVHERNVLEKLQPHTNVEKLSISGYAGTRFPDWVGDSSFSNMVELKLKGCKYCFSLPALGQLGSLKRLSIIGFEEITVVGPEFYGKSNKPPFGCLESLTFRGMRQWKEWVPYSNKDEGDGATAAFPLLQELGIKCCPNLIKTLPADLPSLKTVKIVSCNSFESFSLDLGAELEEIDISGGTKLRYTHLPSLKSVEIMDYDSLESFPLDLGPAIETTSISYCRNLKCLSAVASAELEYLKSLIIRNCPNLKEIQPTHLPSLKSVEIRHCDSLEGYPLDWGPAIEKITICACENLKCLSAVASVELKHLKSLWIVNCPNLKEIQLTHLPSLADLEIMGCDQLVSLPRAPALQRLGTRSHYTEQSLAVELKNPPFTDCDSFKSFPLGFMTDSGTTSPASQSPRTL